MIVVVSGLPRSGTSLLMQMLAAGGLPPLTDNQRLPDEDNPRGYLEWEPIKRLPQQPDLIAEAEGKAVKVVSSLLWALPPGHHYRVIFMERPLEEIAASQAVMIRRRAAQGPALEASALAAALDAHRRQVLDRLRHRPEIALCQVHYHRLLAQPREQAEQIRGFLGLPLDLDAMVRQVDPNLYRQRQAAPSSQSLKDI